MVGSLFEVGSLDLPQEKPVPFDSLILLRLQVLLTLLQLEVFGRVFQLYPLLRPRFERRLLEVAEDGVRLP